MPASLWCGVTSRIEVGNRFSMIHSKYFQDPYSQLREHFFLDLLNQHGAPVPKVLRNDIEGKRIDMEHGGQDLRQWMTQTLDRNESISATLAVIHQALQAVIRVADIGVIHLDVAPRNFVLDTAGSGGFPRVRMIDFSLAVSPLLPLQKPLWILPHASTQYSALQAAIIEDWQAFFTRHDLSAPTNWDQPFDIPLKTYSQDWTDRLAVDHIDLRKPLLAHTLGMLVQQFNELLNLQEIAPNLLQAAQQCLNLQKDADATARIQMLMTSMPEQDHGTPRPRAKTTSPLEIQPEPKASASLPALVTKVAPKLQAIEDVPTPPRGEHPWMHLIAGLLMCGLGFACVNFIYTAQYLRLTDLGFNVLIGLAALWIALSLWALFYKDRVNRWLAQLKLPALALSVLALELWSVHAQQDFWLATVCTLAATTFIFSLRSTRSNNS